MLRANTAPALIDITVAVLEAAAALASSSNPGSRGAAPGGSRQLAEVANAGLLLLRNLSFHADMRAPALANKALLQLLLAAAEGVGGPPGAATGLQPGQSNWTPTQARSWELAGGVDVCVARVQCAVRPIAQNGHCSLRNGHCREVKATGDMHHDCGSQPPLLPLPPPAAPAAGGGCRGSRWHGVAGRRRQPVRRCLRRLGPVGPHLPGGLRGLTIVGR
jgi:hypothetical protein